MQEQLKQMEERVRKVARYIAREDTDYDEMEPTVEELVDRIQSLIAEGGYPEFGPMYPTLVKEQMCLGRRFYGILREEAEAAWEEVYGKMRYEVHDTYGAPQCGCEVRKFAEWWEVEEYLESNPEVLYRIEEGYATIVEAA